MQPQRSRPSKEALFVRVPAPDETVAFHNATAYVGKPMPFAKPQATCGMRASKEVVSFSLLHLTKRTATNIASKELEMPRGPLSRLERRANQLTGEEAGIGADDLLVEMGDASYRFKIERDSNGVLTLETVGEEEDTSFELPKAAVQMSLYLRSPGAGRLLAIGFIGHVGKPETSETVRRVAAMVLFSLSQLTEFKVLANLEVVTVPASSARYAVRPTRKPSERAAVTVPVYLFTDGDAPAPAGMGTMEVEVDLESANPTSNRLLFHVRPSEEIAEIFDAYRSVVDNTVAGVMRQVMGDDDIAAVTYDIVLGDVSSSTVERLKDALTTMEGGLDFTPRMYQPHAG